MIFLRIDSAREQKGSRNENARAIAASTENRGILLPTNYFHQSPANPHITRVINRNSQWRSIMPPRGPSPPLPPYEKLRAEAGGNCYKSEAEFKSRRGWGGRGKKRERKEKEEGRRQKGGRKIGNVPSKVAAAPPPTPARGGDSAGGYHSL